MRRLQAALVALIIAIVSTSVAHLIAALIAPTYSPFVIIGNLLIDASPVSVKEWAIAHFGSHDKQVLLASVGVGIGLIVVAGGLAWGRRTPALRTFITLVSFLPLLLLFTGRRFSPEAFWPPLALIATAQALLYYTWAALRWRIDDIVQASPPAPAISRRQLGAAGAGLLCLSALASLGGQALIASRNHLRHIVLPRPKTRIPPLTHSIDNISGITPLVTPTDAFYRVDVNLAVPVIDEREWSLILARPGYDAKRYTYEDLLSMDVVEQDVTLSCVSNPLAGKYISSGRWLGVPLLPLLESFNYQDGKVDQLLSTAVDGYTASTDLRRLPTSQPMIALGLNGQPLPREHGFPARLLVPGVYGFVGATKWLTRLDLTTYHEHEAYWTRQGWATDAPMKPIARIDVPGSFARVRDSVVVAGVAWAGAAGVKQVEVSVDGGAWQQARVNVPAGDASLEYWVQWSMKLSLAKGDHSLRARAITADGVVQTSARTPPFPNGASGWQSRSFTVV